MVLICMEKLLGITLIALLALLSSILAIKLTDLKRILLFYVTFTLLKTSTLLIFPQSSSWSMVWKNCSLINMVPILLYYAPTLGIIVGYGSKINLRKTLIYALLGTVLGAIIVVPFSGFHNPVIYFLNALTFSVYGGFCEELFFRGKMMDFLENKFNRKIAVLAQALAFGFSHPWNLFAVLGATILGLVQAQIKYKFGIEAAIGLHYGLNIFTHA